MPNEIDPKGPNSVDLARGYNSKNGNGSLNISSQNELCQS
jgi:hypothetical protein